MTDENSRSLIPRPSHEVAVRVPARSRILGEMVEEMLALGRAEPIPQTTARFRIGDYTWCQPDYRQILLWAEALKVEPARLIEKLIAGEESEEVATRFHDGRILSLSWNLNELPLSDFRNVEAVTIEKLRLYKHGGVGLTREKRCEIIALHMASLRFLDCGASGIGTLNLSGVPNLTHISCISNHLTELDLSNVPNLTKIACIGNQLTDLDLSQVPNLAMLSCSWNCLTELDLSCVPNLRALFCDSNRLKELDLSHVPNITRLCCQNNHLTTLDLSHVPNIATLLCSGNHLTNLDLSHVLNLTSLICSRNQLVQLDIRPLRSLEVVDYDAGRTRLIQRPDQNF